MKRINRREGKPDLEFSLLDGKIGFHVGHEAITVGERYDRMKFVEEIRDWMLRSQKPILRGDYGPIDDYLFS